MPKEGAMNSMAIQQKANAPIGENPTHPHWCLGGLR